MLDTVFQQKIKIHALFRTGGKQSGTPLLWAIAPCPYGQALLPAAKN
jgi:hypothetical protein